MAINGRALTFAGLGAVFIWSGIKGWSLLGTLGDVVTGHRPSQSPNAALVDPNYVAPSSGGTFIGPSVSNIVNNAMRYQGHAYSFGGAPGKNGQNAWDCSSFVNWVTGHDCGLAIPGYAAGKYDGSSHGPATGQWGVWPGLTHVQRSDVQGGDIVVWALHMGIALNNRQLISALNPTQGTIITDIDQSGNGPLMCYGRYH